MFQWHFSCKFVPATIFEKTSFWTRYGIDPSVAADVFYAPDYLFFSLLLNFMWARFNVESIVIGKTLRLESVDLLIRFRI